MSDTPLEGIAIIGMAGRFPGAPTVAEFWRKLMAGEELISTISAPAPEGVGQHVPRRGLLEKPEWFDAGFFGISPKEAEVMDPQQRFLLEIAHDPIHAGVVQFQFGLDAALLHFGCKVVDLAVAGWV